MCGCASSSCASGCSRCTATRSYTATSNPPMSSSRPTTRCARPFAAHASPDREVHCPALGAAARRPLCSRWHLCLRRPCASGQGRRSGRRQAAEDARQIWCVPHLAAQRPCARRRAAAGPQSAPATKQEKNMNTNTHTKTHTTHTGARAFPCLDVPRGVLLLQPRRRSARRTT